MLQTCGAGRTTAFHDRIDLADIDRFVGQQRLGHDMQLVQVGLQDVLGARIRLVKDMVRTTLSVLRAVSSDTLLVWATERPRNTSCSSSPWEKDRKSKAPFGQRVRHKPGT